MMNRPPPPPYHRRQVTPKPGRRPPWPDDQRGPGRAAPRTRAPAAPRAVITSILRHDLTAEELHDLDWLRRQSLEVGHDRCHFGGYLRQHGGANGVPQRRREARHRSPSPLRRGSTGCRHHSLDAGWRPKWKELQAMGSAIQEEDPLDEEARDTHECSGGHCGRGVVSLLLVEADLCHGTAGVPPASVVNEFASSSPTTRPREAIRGRSDI